MTRVLNLIHTIIHPSDFICSASMEFRRVYGISKVKDVDVLVLFIGGDIVENSMSEQASMVFDYC